MLILCRLATSATGALSASRTIATISSSLNRLFLILPSNRPRGSLSKNPWSENPGARQMKQVRHHELQSSSRSPGAERSQCPGKQLLGYCFSKFYPHVLARQYFSDVQTKSQKPPPIFPRQ